MTYLVLGLIAGYLVLWFLFEFWNRRQMAAGKPPLSALQRVFASLGALTVLFTGGCGLTIGIAEAMRVKSGAADDFMSVELVAIVSLPPFLIGAFIWWISTRRKSS
jgi:hypothetical protein